MDYPYLFFYIILSYLSYWYWRTRNNFAVKWAFVFSFFFVAFRAPVVGADSWDYIRYLTGERNFYNYDSRPLEPLFIIYRNILCWLTSSRVVVMVFNSIITLYPLYYFIKKYSYNPPLTILMFCFLGGLEVYFVGLRQIMSLAVLYIAYILCIDYKYKFLIKSFLFALCALTSYYLHTSSVLYFFILLISLIPIKMSKKICFLIILGSALFGVVLKNFDVMDFFAVILNMAFSSIERLNNYLLNNELNDITQFTILIRKTIVLLFVFLSIDKDRLSHPFCKIAIISTVVYNFFFAVPMIHRLCAPLYIFIAIVFTWSMGERYKINPMLRRFVNVSLLTIILYFMRSEIINNSSYDLNNENRMHPYYFFFEDYRDHPSIKRF